MSDIKAGDLVMVTKQLPCGCVPFDVGYIFTVKLILDEDLSGFWCDCCGSEVHGIWKMLDDGEYEILESVCIKIPPLSDLEDVTTHRQDLIPNEQEEV